MPCFKIDLMLFFSCPLLISGMGFGQGISKVCRGRAANQSTMVVNFYGTFSGLQEAEKLHELFADKKRGRAEFEHITFQGRISSDKTRNADKVENVLYSYLGIAEDLDKLDFEAKRRCFVKSKKDILTIAHTGFGSK
ncbi:hypothetical protein Patl1_30473 [Pistacia atlantica]|uniref:Uncharacterized protein n=1 Tax=Pistacia atlantica TaxID=434234 RepID=A0ACC1ACK4_9ROSI|nr:hypothetical protein Patl1_30473 [Pistacia atlantica]